MDNLPRAHCILTEGRSGSNWLVELLNSHPHVFNYGEWLNPKQWKTRLLGPWLRRPQGARRWLERAFDSRALFELQYGYLRWRDPRLPPKAWGTLGSVGVKELGFRLRQRGLERWLSEAHAVKVIRLRRRDLLAQAFSWIRLGRTGMVRSEVRSESESLLPVAADELRARVERLSLERRLNDQWAQGMGGRVVWVDYEDLCDRARGPECLARLQRHLGLEPHPLSARSVPLSGRERIPLWVQNREPLREVVAQLSEEGSP